jgi:hypothetical protein
VRTDTLRFDYGDALTDGELELRSAAALVVDQKTGEALVREKLRCQRADRLDHQIDDRPGDPRCRPGLNYEIDHRPAGCRPPEGNEVASYRWVRR